MQKVARIVLVLFWMLIIFITLTTQLPVYQENGPPGSDKLVHIFLFGIFSCLVIYSLIESRAKKFIHIFLFSFLISGSYAVFMEYLQSSVPTRSASVYDLLAGIFGILIAQIIFYGIYFRKKT